MLSCKEFVTQQNARLDGREFSLGQRMSLAMHYFICHHCRRYLKQLKLVDAVGKGLSDTKPDPSAIESSLDIIKSNHDEKEK